MNKSTIFALVGSLIAIVIAIVALVGVNSIPAQTTQVTPLGYAGSPNNFPHGFINTEYGYYLGGTNSAATPVIDQYGNVLATNISTNGYTSTSTTASSETMTAATLASSTVILFQPLLAAPTVTLPATSTLSNWLPNTGNAETFYVFENSATSSTFVGGSGMDMSVGSSTVGSIVLNGKKLFSFEAVREATGGNIAVLVGEGI